MDAEALGGTIELDQRSAFDFPKSTIEGHIGSGYFHFSLAGQYTDRNPSSIGNTSRTDQ
jgi:hypothetical protein